MTEFKDGDKVRAIRGDSVLEGTIRAWVSDTKYFDIRLDDSYQFAQLKRGEWTLQPVKPSAQEILRDMKLGGRFITPNVYPPGFYMKYSETHVVYVTSQKTLGSANTISDFPKDTVVTVLED